MPITATLEVCWMCIMILLFMAKRVTFLINIHYTSAGGKSKTDSEGIPQTSYLIQNNFIDHN